MNEEMNNSSQGLMFSLAYQSPYRDDDDYAADWGHIKGRWTYSSREYGLGQRWEFCNNLDEHAYKALLETFGLKKEDFPLEKIVVMSPRELTRISGRDPLSDTLGDRRHASEVED